MAESMSVDDLILVPVIGRPSVVVALEIIIASSLGGIVELLGFCISITSSPIIACTVQTAGTGLHSGVSSMHIGNAVQSPDNVSAMYAEDEAQSSDVSTMYAEDEAQSPDVSTMYAEDEAHVPDVSTMHAEDEAHAVYPVNIGGTVYEVVDFLADDILFITSDIHSFIV